MKNFHLNEVKEETHDSDDEHEVSFDLWLHEESLGSLTEKPESHDPDGSNRDQSSHNFSSVPPESQVGVRVLLAKLKCGN